MRNSTFKRSGRNQKLSDQQIRELKALKNNGVRIHLIAQIISKEHGVAKSAIYYHLSDNRQAYDNQAKLIRASQRERIKERIHALIEEGFNTQYIAEQWNIPLKHINRIYTT